MSDFFPAGGHFAADGAHVAGRIARIRVDHEASVVGNFAASSVPDLERIDTCCDGTERERDGLDHP
jgi:hypothetical protein